MPEFFDNNDFAGDEASGAVVRADNPLRRRKEEEITPPEAQEEARGAWGDVTPPARHRGPVIRQDRRICIGRVGAPPGLEATSREFHFWVPDEALVEVSQIVTVESRVRDIDADGTPTETTVTHYALVEEVRRTSRRKGMGHEYDESDGDLTETPPFGSEGMTYAQASILRADPPRLTPPRERSEVLLASESEARAAYGAADGELENPLAVGLIRNGGERSAGPGYIDLDYLLGANGGHLNVNGAAGRGTKSSFLLFVLYMLVEEARRQAQTRPSDPERLLIAPIVFNVKGFDLFYMDKPSTRFVPEKHGAAWRALGVEEPRPFAGVEFYAPQQPGSSLPQMNQREGVQPYSWGLEDVIERDLFGFLFSDEDAANDNFSVLLLDLEAWLTQERAHSDGSVTLHPANRENAAGERINTFEKLLEWLGSSNAALPGQHHAATIRKMHRRLQKILLESRGVLRRREARGYPLTVTSDGTAAPKVIDLSSLTGAASLQRFVVATVLRQLVQAQTLRPVAGMKYLVFLDELNRFAPRGGRDPITRLIEQVAAEMRSQGILLFGAQQQASLVSEKVIENAGIKALGKTGMLELANSVWRGLSATAKIKADGLLPDEKLILQDNFRQPMHVRIPFPAWAMRRAEAVLNAPASGGGSADTAGSSAAAASASHDRFIDD